METRCFITADEHKQMILTSQISSITQNQTGKFQSRMKWLLVRSFKKLRYGLEGKFVMVTGERTFQLLYGEANLG